MNWYTRSMSKQAGQGVNDVFLYDLSNALMATVVPTVLNQIPPTELRQWRKRWNKPRDFSMKNMHFYNRGQKSPGVWTFVMDFGGIDGLWAKRLVGGCKYYMDGHQIKYGPEREVQPGVFEIEIMDANKPAPKADYNEKSRQWEIDDPKW